MTSEPKSFTRVSTALALVLVLAVVGSQGSCADFERGPATLSDAGGFDGASDAGISEAGTLSFASSVHGLLIAACQPCHSAGQEAGDTRLLLVGDASSDYAVIILFVSATAPASSRLLAKMSGQGHGGGAIYASDSPSYQTILQWIQQGAGP